MRFLFVGPAVLVVACANESLVGPQPVPPPVLAAELAVPAPLGQLELVFLAPPDQGNQCPESFPDVEWHLEIGSQDTEWLVIQGKPAWGTLHPRDMVPVRPKCLDKAIGVGGPVWLPLFDREPEGGAQGHPDPSNPYRYLVRRGTRGRVMCCQQDAQGGACGKFTIASFNEPA